MKEEIVMDGNVLRVMDRNELSATHNDTLLYITVRYRGWHYYFLSDFTKPICHHSNNLLHINNKRICSFVE